MLLGLFAAIAFAPIYWIVVPEQWRRGTVALASLAALTLYDSRLLPLLVVLTALLFALMRAAKSGNGTGAAAAAIGIAALTALFVWNKLAGGGLSTLPSQTGLVFLGLSFLYLKAAAALVESTRGTIDEIRYPDVLAWIVFLPTYPSGPMADFDRFRQQLPAYDNARFFGGLERILFGLVKALLGSYYLGVWSTPIVAAPHQHPPWQLLLGLYACSLRFYFDFAGYSDIAIGLSALYGYDIEENFDRPFARRNLVLLWQHWHMTLTRWLRTYLFIPVSRRLLRYRSHWDDRLAILAGQMAAMVFCGLWHGFGWNFVLWGVMQGLCLTWVGTLCRDVGRLAPPALTAWWRRSPIAYALSTALTFNVFSLLIIFIVTDVDHALTYLRRMLGP